MYVHFIISYFIVHCPLFEVIVSFCNNTETVLDALNILNSFRPCVVINYFEVVLGYFDLLYVVTIFIVY